MWLIQKQVGAKQKRKRKNEEEENKFYPWNIFTHRMIFVDLINPTDQ